MVKRGSREGRPPRTAPERPSGGAFGGALTTRRGTGLRLKVNQGSPCCEPGTSSKSCPSGNDAVVACSSIWRFNSFIRHSCAVFTGSSRNSHTSPMAYFNQLNWAVSPQGHASASEWDTSGIQQRRLPCWSGMRFSARWDSPQEGQTWKNRSSFRSFSVRVAWSRRGVMIAVVSHAEHKM